MDKNNLILRYAKLKFLYENGEYLKAWEECVKIDLDKIEDFEPLLEIRYLLALKIGEFEEADKTLRLLIKLSERKDYYLEKLGNLYSKILEDFDKKIIDTMARDLSSILNESYDFNSYLIASYLLGFVFFKLLDDKLLLATSLKLAKTIQEKDPKSWWGYWLEVNVNLIYWKEESRVLSILTNAIKHVDDYRVYTTLAEIYFKMGDWEKLEKIIQITETKYGAIDEILFYKALLKKETNQFEEALEIFLKVKSNYNNQDLINYQLFYCYSVLGLKEEAQGILNNINLENIGKDKKVIQNILYFSNKLDLKIEKLPSYRYEGIYYWLAKNDLSIEDLDVEERQLVALLKDFLKEETDINDLRIKTLSEEKFFYWKQVFELLSGKEISVNLKEEFLNFLLTVNPLLYSKFLNADDDPISLESILKAKLLVDLQVEKDVYEKLSKIYPMNNWVLLAKYITLNAFDEVLSIKAFVNDCDFLYVLFRWLSENKKTNLLLVLIDTYAYKYSCNKFLTLAARILLLEKEYDKVLRLWQKWPEKLACYAVFAYLLKQEEEKAKKLYLELPAIDDPVFYALKANWQEDLYEKEKLLLKALEEGFEHEWVYYNLASVYQQLGDYVKALYYLDSIHETYEILLKKFELAKKQGDIDYIVSIGKKILDKRFDEKILDELVILLQEGREEELTNILKEQLSKNFEPKFALKLGKILFKLGDLQEAKKYLEKAVFILKEEVEPEYLLLLAKIYVLLFEWDKALQYVEKYLNIDVGNTEARKLYVKILINLERYEDAAGELEILLDDLIDDEELLIQAVSVYEKLEDLDRLSEIYGRLLMLTSNNEYREKLAQIFEKKGEYENAARQYKTLYDETLDEKYEILYAVNLAKLGKVEEATNILKKYVDRDVDNALAYFELGKLYLIRGRIEEALEVLEKAREKEPDNIYILFELGKVYRTFNYFEKAVEVFEAIKEKVDAKLLPDVLKHLGQLYVLLGRKEEAFLIYEQLQQLLPNDPVINFEIGKIYEQEGQLDLALQYYQKAVEKQEKPEWLFALGRVYKKQGQLDKALIYLDKVVKIDENFLDVKYLLADIYLEKGDLDNAAKLYEEIISQSKDYEALLKLAQIKEQIGDEVEAISYYEEAFSMNPDMKIILKLKTFYENIQDWQKLLDILNKAVLSMKNNPILYYERGKIYKQLGEIDKALADFKKALQLNPEYVDVLYELGTLSIEQGQIRQATSYVEKILSIFPRSIKARMLRVKILKLQGKNLEVLEELRECVKIDPTFYEARVMLGEVLENSGLIAEALEHYEKAYEIKPDSSIALKIAQLAKRLGLEEKTQEYLELAKNVQSTNIDYLKKMLLLMAEQEKYNEVVEYADRILSEVESDSTALLLKFKALYYLGKYDEAWQLAVDIKDLIYSNEELMKIYMKLAKKVDEEEYIDVALQLFERGQLEEDEILEIVKLLLDREVYDTAYELLSKVKASEKDYPIRAFVAWRLGRKQEAFDWLLKIKKVYNPEFIIRIVIESNNLKLWNKFKPVIEVLKVPTILEEVAKFLEANSKLDDAFAVYKKLIKFDSSYILKAIDLAERIGLKDEVEILKQQLKELKDLSPKVKVKLVLDAYKEKNLKVALNYLKDLSIDDIDDPDDKIMIAKVLFEAGKKQEAEEILVSTTPNSKNAKILKAELLSEIDVDLAVDYLEDLVSLEPEEDYILLLADFYMQANRKQEAVSILESIDTPKARKKLMLLNADENPVQAIEFLEQQETLTPSEKLLLARLYINTEQHDKALQILENNKNNFSDLLQVNILRAKAYLKKQEKSKALMLLKDLYSKDPDNIDVLILLGEAYTLNENYEEARKIFGKIEGIIQDKPQLFEKVGLVYFEAKDFTKAKMYLEKALEENLLSIEGKKALALIYHIDCMFNQLDDLLIPILDETEDINLKLYFGKLKYVENYLEMALEVLEPLLDKARSNIEIRFVLAEIYSILGDFASAKQMLQEVMDIEDSEKVHLKLAMVYARERDFSMAKAEAEKALSKKKNINTLMGMSMIYYEMENYDKCLAELKKLQSAVPDNIEVRLALAKTYLKFAEKFGDISLVDQAKKEITYLEINMGVPEEKLYFINAEIAYFDKNYEEALRLFKKAVMQEPFNYEIFKRYLETRQIWLDKELQVHLNSAASFKEKGMLESAKMEYLEVLGLQPDNYEANVELGKIEYNLGNLKEAKKYFEIAISHYQNDVEVFKFYGKLLIELEEWEKATEILENGILLDPTDANLHLLRANVLEKTGNIEEAIDEYKEAIKLNSSLVEAALVLARYYAGKEEKDEAKHYYNLVLANDPNNQEALDYLATLQESEIKQKVQLHLDEAEKLLKEGNLSRALTEYEMAVDLYPNCIQARLKMAEIYEELNNPSQAIFEYERVIELDEEKYKHLYEKMAWLALKLKDYKRALEVLKKYYLVDGSNLELRKNIVEVYIKYAFYETKGNLDNMDEVIKMFEEKKDEFSKYEVAYLLCNLPAYAISEQNPRGKGISILNSIKNSIQDDDVWYQLALAYKKEENLDEALEVLNEAIEKFGTDKLKVLKGLVLELTSNYDEAAEIYLTLLKNTKKAEYIDYYLEVRKQQMKVLEEKEKNAFYRNQLSLAKGLMKEEPEEVVYQLFYCWIALNLTPKLTLDGHLRDEIEVKLKDIISKKEDCAYAYWGLKTLYQKDALAGDTRAYEMAIDFTRKVLDFYKDWSRAYYELASVYNENIVKNTKSEALNYYQEAILLDPLYIPPHYRLGQLFRVKGMNQEAKEEYEKVIQLDPSTSYAREARNALVHIERLEQSIGDTNL